MYSVLVMVLFPIILFRVDPSGDPRQPDQLLPDPRGFGAFIRSSRRSWRSGSPESQALIRRSCASDALDVFCVTS